MASTILQEVSRAKNSSYVVYFKRLVIIFIVININVIFSIIIIIIILLLLLLITINITYYINHIYSI